jgi:hypothetical protein
MTDNQRKNLELVKSGFANGISTQLATKQAIFGPRCQLLLQKKNKPSLQMPHFIMENFSEH